MRLVTRRGPSVALVVSHAAGMARPPAAGMARPPGAAAKRAGHRIPPPLPTTPPPLARASTHEGYVTKSRPGYVTGQSHVPLKMGCVTPANRPRPPHMRPGPARSRTPGNHVQGCVTGLCP